MILETIYPVTNHTDHVGPQSTFVAVQGHKEDGLLYIPQALAQGAKRIVVGLQARLKPETLHAIWSAGAELVFVDEPRKALAEISAHRWGYPAKQLKIIGITGTKGKTTTAFLVEHLLKSAGHRTALITGLKNSIIDSDFPATLTTPQPDYLHMFFAKCVDAQVEYVVMEVAAQAFTLHRVQGLQFDGIIFTNFSQEHLEFYPDLDSYFTAKCAVFDMAKRQAPVFINADDIWSNSIILPRKKVKYFGIINKHDTEIQTTICAQSPHLVIDVNYQGVQTVVTSPHLLGAFNAYNLSAAISMALAHGVPLSSIKEGMSTFPGVPGRLEKHISSKGTTWIIDYAHNPSSFTAVLSTLRALTPQLIVIFGCGGERDATKRPLMGDIAATYADHVILTSDNPRSENPQDIINEIMMGISDINQRKVIIEIDREAALKKAHALAGAHTIVAVLGKGPDEYQLIDGKKLPFSEKSIIKSLE